MEQKEARQLARDFLLLQHYQVMSIVNNLNLNNAADHGLPELDFAIRIFERAKKANKLIEFQNAVETIGENQIG